MILRGFFKTVVLVLVIVLILIYSVFIYGYSYYEKHVTLRKLLPEKTIALTFDDGPVAETKILLSSLKELGVHATFFVLGNEVEKNTTWLKEIHANGHEIGNHSYTHPHYIGLKSKKSIVNELERTSTLIKQTIGVAPKVFRAPYGESSMYYDRVVRTLGMQPFLWTLSTVDWHENTTVEVLRVRLQNIHQSEIILMHDRVYKDPAKLSVLKENILRLQKEGFRFVTLSELQTN